jgi:hypothetical protein
MRWTMIAAVVAAASLTSSLSGGGESSPETKKVTQKLGETWDAMKAWGIDKKDDLVKSSSEGLDTLKQKMADAKQAAPGVTADARQKLDEEWKAVQVKFDEMKGASGPTWDKARDAFLQAYDGLKKKLAAATAK